MKVSAFSLPQPQKSNKRHGNSLYYKQNGQHHAFFEIRTSKFWPSLVLLKFFHNSFEPHLFLNCFCFHHVNYTLPHCHKSFSYSVPEGARVKVPPLFFVLIICVFLCSKVIS